MATTPRATGRWQSLGRVTERMPLRVKLITALLGLVVVALAVISLVGIEILRGYLLGGVDQTLALQQNQVSSQLKAGALHLGGPQACQVGGAVTWVPDSGNPVPLDVPVDAIGYAGQCGPRVPGPSIPANAGSIPQNPGAAITVGSASGGTPWRIVGISATVQTARGSQTHGTIVVATDASTAYRTIGRLTTIDISVSLVVMLFLAAAGTALIRGSLRPLTEIERTAAAIADGDLTRRVPELDPRTEVGRLGRSLNVMLSHIETAFRARSRSEHAARRSEERLRQFVADASHELRTPLTAIRGFAEYYRQRGGVEDAAEQTAGSAAEGTAGSVAATNLADALATTQNGNGHLTPADLDRIMSRVEQEAARMGVLVEDMLLLARLDQQRPVEHKTVDLLALTADAVHDARMVAPARDINLTVAAGAALLVDGDEIRLRQVIGNLMSNALAHTPAGTAIDVLVRAGRLDEAADPPPQPTQAGAAADFVFAPDTGALGASGGHEQRPAAVVEVADHGPGITSDQAQHVFERFYRVNQARTAGGTGLGLAIVAALVKAHGGTVWVRSRPGSGATFCIALPLTPEAMEGDSADPVTPAAPPQQPPAQPPGS